MIVSQMSVLLKGVTNVGMPSVCGREEEEESSSEGKSSFFLQKVRFPAKSHMASRAAAGSGLHHQNERKNGIIEA